MIKQQTATFSAGLDGLGAIRDFVRGFFESLEVERDVIDDLIFAANELATNVIKYGYSGGVGRIEIRVACDSEFASLRIRDEAPLFDPTQASSPDLTLPLEIRPLGKMGIYLTMDYMDDVQYHPLGQTGNEITLKKKLRKET
ncbi:MAG: ATP-binding protein [Chloroflexi bacterium]|nr:ATP-binding protein [Chloroflexota bacterium]MDL1885022.1 ATP-binding protein [Anaerolineae bacterium CFX8]